MMEWEQIRDELVRQRERLMRQANVLGCGMGFKEKEGRITAERAIVVFVRRKLPLRQLRRRDRVPPQIGACRTDVVEVGELRALARPRRLERLRPARPGSSISHFKVSAGTFGAVVYDRESGEPLILSNNHVLANSSSVDTPRAQSGDPVYQPGTYDGGDAHDIIGHLLRFVPLITTEERYHGAAARLGQTLALAFHRIGLRLAPPAAGAKPEQRNLVDAAVARPLTRSLIDPDILRIGPLTGMTEAFPGLAVKKSGRTTGLNTGTVRAVAATLDISMGEAGVARFEDQIVTTPMAEPGDSGSAVVDRCNRFVGLLFAGSDQATICNRAVHVAEALHIRYTAASARKRPEVDSGSRNAHSRGRLTTHRQA